MGDFPRVPQRGEEIALGSSGSQGLEIARVVWTVDGTVELYLKMPKDAGENLLTQAGWTMSR